MAALADVEWWRGGLPVALEHSERAKCRRPAYDAVLMFEVLVPRLLYRDGRAEPS